MRARLTSAAAVVAIVLAIAAPARAWEAVVQPFTFTVPPNEVRCETDDVPGPDPDPCSVVVMIEGIWWTRTDTLRAVPRGIPITVRDRRAPVPGYCTVRVRPFDEGGPACGERDGWSPKLSRVALFR